MKTTLLVLGLVVLFVGAHAGPDNDVKLAFAELLKAINASPERVQAIEQGWDGYLPGSLAEHRQQLQTLGFNELEINNLQDGLTTVAKNKDNPSWKTHYGNIYIQILGGDKSKVEKLEQELPDHIPRDPTEMKEALKKMGLPEDHAAGHGKFAAWLAQVRE